VKTELEHQDIEAIAQRVLELLKPHVSINPQCGDGVFDKDSLSNYLKVSPGTINKLVSDHAIPFFKISEGKCGGVRFRRKEIDEWIRKRTLPDLKR